MSSSLYLEPADSLRAEQLDDFDALILLTARFAADSVHPNGRLAVVARFGVGYDNVAVEALHAGRHRRWSSRPDGVRRPVAVSIITLMLALTGKLMIKDKPHPRGAGRLRPPRPVTWVYGLVGRTLGSLGIGNIGAELFRLAKPFDMAFIAHDPYARPAIAARAWCRARRARRSLPAEPMCCPSTAR